MYSIISLLGHVRYIEQIRPPLFPITPLPYNGWFPSLLHRRIIDALQIISHLFTFKLLLTIRLSLWTSSLFVHRYSTIVNNTSFLRLQRFISISQERYGNADDASRTLITPTRAHQQHQHLFGFIYLYMDQVTSISRRNS